MNLADSKLLIIGLVNNNCDIMLSLVKSSHVTENDKCEVNRYGNGSGHNRAMLVAEISIEIGVKNRQLM